MKKDNLSLGWLNNALAMWDDALVLWTDELARCNLQRSMDSINEECFNKKKGLTMSNKIRHAQELERKVVYLAGPFSNDNIYIEALNYLTAHYVGDLLVQKGATVFNPITNSGLFKQQKAEWKDWMRMDKDMLQRLTHGNRSEVIMILLPFYHNSVGANIEKTIAEERAISIRTAWTYTDHNTTVLLSGKSGSGKTTIANRLHNEIGGPIHSIARNIKQDVHDLYKKQNKPIGSKEEMQQAYIEHRDKLRAIYGNTYWVDKVFTSFYYNYIDDVRLPEEMDFFDNSNPLKVRLSCHKSIRRSRGASVDINHPTETALDNYKNFDIVLKNETDDDLEINTRLLTLSIITGQKPSKINQQMLQLVSQSINTD